MSRLAPNRHTAPATNVVQELVFTHDLRPAASMFECLRAVWIEAEREAHGAYSRVGLRAGADSAASD
jgi:hypothetical protein